MVPWRTRDMLYTPTVGHTLIKRYVDASNNLINLELEVSHYLIPPLFIPSCRDDRCVFLYVVQNSDDFQLYFSSPKQRQRFYELVLSITADNENLVSLVDLRMKLCAVSTSKKMMEERR